MGKEKSCRKSKYGGVRIVVCIIEMIKKNAIIHSNRCANEPNANKMLMSFLNKKN